MTQSEYLANKRGLNIFFGAILVGTALDKYIQGAGQTVTRHDDGPVLRPPHQVLVGIHFQPACDKTCTTLHMTGLAVLVEDRLDVSLITDTRLKTASRHHECPQNKRKACVRFSVHHISLSLIADLLQDSKCFP